MRPGLSFARRALPWLWLLYCVASLLHFAHNAEHVADYPNLPGWLSRGDIYLAWCAVALVGIVGFALYARGRELLGLTVLAVYAALGFDGLLHYGRAPLSAHNVAMNTTILTEVVAAGLLLLAIAALAAERLPRSAVRS